MSRATAPKQPALLPVDQGRKRRGPNTDNLDLLESFKRVLMRVGGEDWLVKFANAHPKEFVAALVRVVPLQIKADVSNLEIVVHRLEMPLTPIPGVLASPVQGHVMQLVHDAAIEEHERAAPQD